jgi:hypothetical protein
MTKKEAIMACKKHWEFLRDNPRAKKTDYIPAKKWRSGCAACEYDNNAHEYCANTCIIPWPKDNDGDCGCVTLPSPFYYWKPGDTKSVEAIVQLCDLALKRLEEEKNV